jgi:hypothetical protein
VRAYLNKPVSNEVLKEHIAVLLQELRAEDLAAFRHSGGARGEANREPDLEKELNIILSGGRNPEETEPGREGAGAPRSFRLADGSDKVYLALLHVGRKSGGDPELTREQMDGIRLGIRRFSAASPAAATSWRSAAIRAPRACTRCFGLRMTPG